MTNGKIQNPKVTIVGAGNVGSTLAERILMQGLADVVLVDVVPGLARGKTLDLMDAAPLMGYRTSVIGTDNYEATKASDIVVITAGLPRKPGMSRDDLIAKNLGIVKSVLGNVQRTSPGAIVVIVTNPLDIITYCAYRELGCERSKILGMAGSLDTARFKSLLSESLGIPAEKIETFVLGSHGDTMVPLVSRTLVDNKALRDAVDASRLDELTRRTKKRGGEIVSLLKSGSAYFSPSAACFDILKAIINDEKRIIPCSCILEGEYGIDKCAAGVPARIGRKGIVEIIEWELPEDELEALKKSARAIKDTLSKL